jgi:hypothetical protein
MINRIIDYATGFRLTLVPTHQYLDLFCHKLLGGLLFDDIVGCFGKSVKKKRPGGGPEPPCPALAFPLLSARCAVA